MPSTRAYTRSELEGLRRGALQSLYKLHNLRGANGKTEALVNGLLDHFASPGFVTSQAGGGNSPRHGSVLNKPARSRVVDAQTRLVVAPKATAAVGAQRKSPRRIAGLKGIRTAGAGARADLKQGARPGAADTGPSGPARPSTRPAVTPVVDINMDSDPLAGPSSITQEMIATADVRALLEERDRHWQQKLKLAEEAWTEKLASVEADFEERLRLVLAEQEGTPAIASARMDDEGEGMSPVRLGKRPIRDDDPIDMDGEVVAAEDMEDQGNAAQDKAPSSQPMRRSFSFSPRKRARVMQSLASPAAAPIPIPLITPPAVDGPIPSSATPHTPTPGASNTSTLAAPPQTPHIQPDSETSIPRTPSPSHQGILPDQSKTPGIGSDLNDPSFFTDLVHPSRRAGEEDEDAVVSGLKTPAPLPYPIFATTPRPAEPRSPTLDAPPSARRGKDTLANAHMSVLTPGRTPGRQRPAPRAVSAAHQDLSTVTESPLLRPVSGPPATPGTTSSLLGQGTPLARRVISADSGPMSALLGPELVSAGALLSGRGRTASPPQLLPSPDFAQQFTFARPALPSSVSRKTPRKDYTASSLGIKNSPAIGQPTPRHRTMLGTERYRDTRFGDLEDGSGGAGLGVWGTPRVDLGASIGSDARFSMGSGQDSPTEALARVDAPDVSPP